MTPRFFARAISFLIAVPFRSIRGASRSALPSMDSVATASLFAMPVVRPAIPALPPIFNLQFAPTPSAGHQARSEEHTSELQSLMRISYAVFCLKKKNNSHTNQTFKTHYTKRNDTTEKNNKQNPRI